MDFMQQNHITTEFAMTKTIPISREVLEKVKAALEINTRKTSFIVRDYKDDTEAKKGVALGKEALTLLTAAMKEPEAQEKNVMHINPETGLGAGTGTGSKPPQKAKSAMLYGKEMSAKLFNISYRCEDEDVVDILREASLLLEHQQDAIATQHVKGVVRSASELADIYAPELHEALSLDDCRDELQRILEIIFSCPPDPVKAGKSVEEWSDEYHSECDVHYLRAFIKRILSTPPEPRNGWQPNPSRLYDHFRTEIARSALIENYVYFQDRMNGDVWRVWLEPLPDSLPSIEKIDTGSLLPAPPHGEGG